MKAYGSKSKRSARKAIKKSIKSSGESYKAHKSKAKSKGFAIRNLFN